MENWFKKFELILKKKIRCKDKNKSNFFNLKLNNNKYKN